MMRHDCVYLRGRIDQRSALEQLADHVRMPLLAGQMQRVQPIGVRRVDVHARLEYVQHFLQVAIARGAEKTRMALGLQGDLVR